MKIYEAIEHLIENPRKSNKTLEVSTEILADFAVWCEDQGHFDDYEKHYPNHDCQYANELNWNPVLVLIHKLSSVSVSTDSLPSRHSLTNSGSSGANNSNK